MRDQSGINKQALIVEGVASGAYLLITQGAVFTSLALFFGLDLVALGIAASFPLVFQVFQLIGPRLAARARNRVALMNLLNALRFVWLVPLGLALAGRRSPLVFVLVFGASQAANALAGNVWADLSRDVVPHAERGAYFGRRSIWVSAATFLAIPAYSWLMDEVAEPWNAAAVVACGLAATLVSIGAMRPVRVAEARATEGRAAFAACLGDRNFLRLVLAFAVWNLVVQISAPFFSYHQLRHLGMSMSLVGATTVASNILMILAYRVWGRIADRAGHKSVLILGLSIVSAIPGLWLFMGEPVWPWILGVDVVLTALGWAAVNIAMLTLPMEAAGEGSGAAWFAVLNAAGGLAGLVGSIAGGFLARLVDPWRLSLFGVDVYGLQVLFAACAGLRFLALGLFVRVEAKRYVRPEVLVANLVAAVARRAPLRVEEEQEPPGLGGSEPAGAGD